MDVILALGDVIAVLGKKVVSLVPEKWTSISSRFHFGYSEDDRKVLYTIKYTTENGEDKEISSKSEGIEIQSEALAVRNEINKGNKGRVSAFDLSIDSEGKFGSKIDYFHFE